ncbi:MAG: XdhC family protein [Gemmatimonadaceae bacterium]|nr:XdhC family protein [Gemmatimonadaceae bacterium]
MKQWLETRQVFDTLAAWHAAGTACALATVVRVRGSAYRHEGAKLVVAADGRYVGNVSGGCLEADVREVALRVIASGIAERRQYCGGSDDVRAWDLGVGCEGTVEVLIEPVVAVRATERAALADGRPYLACTRLVPGTDIALGPGEAARRVILGGAGPHAAHGSLGDPALDAHVEAAAARWLDEGRSTLVVHGDLELFVDVLLPAPRLVVCSAGDDARLVARLADEVGFRTVVVDRRPALLAAARFPASVQRVECEATTLAEQLVLTADDHAVVWVRALLATPVRYLGVLGPRARTERILAALAREGVAVEASRLYAPVGLDIGTDGAEQVALAIVAELLAVRSGRRPMSLRERRAPIHAAEPAR